MKRRRLALLLIAALFLALLAASYFFPQPEREGFFEQRQNERVKTR